jgi:hypothetical protein
MMVPSFRQFPFYWVEPQLHYTDGSRPGTYLDRFPYIWLPKVPWWHGLVADVALAVRLHLDQRRPSSPRRQSHLRSVLNAYALALLERCSDNALGATALQVLDLGLGHSDPGRFKPLEAYGELIMDHLIADTFKLSATQVLEDRIRQQPSLVKPYLKVMSAAAIYEVCGEAVLLEQIALATRLQAQIDPATAARLISRLSAEQRQVCADLARRLQ